MLLFCTSSFKARFYFTAFPWISDSAPHGSIPTCLFLESHWESLTKTGCSECESVPLALSTCSGADHLTTSSRLGQVGPLDQAWETHAVTTAKLLHSPSSFRLLCPPRPTLLLPPCLAGGNSSTQLDPTGTHWKNPFSALSCMCVSDWKITSGKTRLVSGGLEEV